jgi:hypothetical protein
MTEDELHGCLGRIHSESLKLVREIERLQRDVAHARHSANLMAYQADYGIISEDVYAVAEVVWDNAGQVLLPASDGWMPGMEVPA